MTRRDFRRFFPPRKRTSHKGDFGRIFILAGSRDYPGAPYLTGMGALRAGGGLITLGVPKSLYPILSRRLAEVMTKPLPENRSGSLGRNAGKRIEQYLADQDVLAMGPGLGRHSETQALIRQVIQASRIPVVIDADGLNAFKGYLPLLQKRAGKIPNLILTPHPGEAARLAGHKIPSDDNGRKQFAKDFAMRHKVILVLKGHHTVVASPDGKAVVNHTGNPGLATGGSGDLLTGIVAAFLGQGLDPYAAARCAVYIHGYAADWAAKEFGEISLTPTDVLNYLPRAFKKILGR